MRQQSILEWQVTLQESEAYILNKLMSYKDVTRLGAGIVELSLLDISE